MGLIKGDIVTVLKRDSFFHDLQGEVETLLEQGSRLEFGIRLAERVIYPDYLDENGLVWFARDQLRKDNDWRAITLAKKHFPNLYHSVKELNFPFSPKNDCMVEECPEKVYQRILFNIWGTVCQADACEEHADRFHQKCMDMFPWKKGWKNQV